MLRSKKAFAIPALAASILAATSLLVTPALAATNGKHLEGNLISMSVLLNLILLGVVLITACVLLYQLADSSMVYDATNEGYVRNNKAFIWAFAVLVLLIGFCFLTNILALPKFYNWPI